MPGTSEVYCRRLNNERIAWLNKALLNGSANKSFAQLRTLAMRAVPGKRSFSPSLVKKTAYAVQVLHKHAGELDLMTVKQVKLPLGQQMTKWAQSRATERTPFNKKSAALKQREQQETALESIQRTVGSLPEELHGQLVELQNTMRMYKYQRLEISIQADGTYVSAAFEPTRHTVKL